MFCGGFLDQIVDQNWIVIGKPVEVNEEGAYLMIICPKLVIGQETWSESLSGIGSK